MRPHFHHGRPWGRRGGTKKEAEAGPSIKNSEELVLLDPGNLRFRDENAQLQMQSGDEDEWTDVSLIQLFPFSQSDGWVSVVDSDGQELGILEDLRKLEAPSLALARQELERKYFMPRIRRIYARKIRNDTEDWHVETDKGETRFKTKALRDSVQQPLPGRLLLTDVEGNRYEVASLEELDPHSQKLLADQL